MAAAVLIDERALILGPAQIAAQMSRLLTGAGFVCLCTDNVTRLGEWLAEGVGLLIAANSTLPTDPQSPLQVFIDQQPVWSDLPVLLLLDTPLQVPTLPPHDWAICCNCHRLSTIPSSFR